MADSAIADFTAGGTAVSTDRIAAARSPFGAGDDRYLTPGDIQAYLVSVANNWAGVSTFTGAITGASNVIEQRNSTNAQLSRTYNTYTDASNYERLTLGYISNVAYLRADKLGTGAARDLKIWGGGDVYIEPNNGGFTGVVRINATSVYINGSNGFRPESSGVLTFLDSVGSNFTRINMGGSSSSFNGIARDGAGTKFVGADGTSVSWSKVPPVAIASLPAAATAGNGARSFVTDALAPTWGATVTAGGAVSVPVYSDGSNWKVG